MRRKHYQIINSKTWYLQDKYFILAGIIIVIVELELILHTDAVKQVKALDEGSEHPAGPEEL